MDAKMDRRRVNPLYKLASSVPSLVLLAIAGLQLADARIFLPAALFRNDSGSTAVSSSTTCDAGSQYYDQSVLGCNTCIAGLGTSTASNPLLVRHQVAAT